VTPSQAARFCLLSPEFWVLLGTPLPPLNILFAAGFAVTARIRGYECASACACCVNVQITYTFLFYAPLAAGFFLADWPFAQRAVPPGSQAAVVTGIALGLLCALSILLLIFFNTRAFAEAFLGRELSTIPRIRLFPECRPRRPS